jgi:hypothetical protein
MDSLYRCNCWTRYFVVGLLAVVVVPLGANGTLAACKKGAELPDCANYKIAVGGKSLTVENNCEQGLRVHVDKRGRFCPDKDAFVGAGDTIAMDTGNCRFEYVRQCR